MSETTEDLQGVAPTPDAEPPAADVNAEPGAVPFDGKIAEILAFHGTPVAGQALREVLGWLGRTAGEAARRMPKNRPAELRGKGWEKSSLLALAELCELLAPSVGTINAPSDPDLFPTATSPAPGDIEAQRAELESHRAQVVRELAAKQAQLAEAPTETEVRETEQAVEIVTLQLGAERLWHSPDPAVDDEYAPPVAYTFHRPDPVAGHLTEYIPANADESRSVIGREQGEPPF